ncbi:MAG TPA: SMI1/KNR4 family protein, partial [Bacillota bacterium]
MAGNDYINHSYMIKHGPYKDFECTIRKVQTNPVVKIYADIQFIRKTVEIELKPEDLGLPIEVELSQYPSNIVETWINNCINHNQMKQFLNYGASEADIDSFKSKLNIEVPDCFYQFYRNFNGMRYSKLDEISDNGYFLYDQSSAILNLNDVLETKRSWDVFIRDMRLN